MSTTKPRKSRDRIPRGARASEGWSRRSFLQVSGLAAGGSLLFGCAASREAQSKPGGKLPEGYSKKTLHFDLSHAKDIDTPHRLHLGGRLYTLKAHTEATRAAHREGSPTLTAVADAKLTHHALDVAVPNDAVVSFTVSAGLKDHPTRTLLHAGIHLPPKALDQARELMGEAWHYGKHHSGHFGLGGGKTDTAEAISANDLTTLYSPIDAALWAVFHHPDLLSIDPTTAAMVASHIQGTEAFEALYIQIATLGVASTMGSDTAGWAVPKWATDAKGAKIQRSDFDLKPVPDDAGNPVYNWNYVPAPEIKKLMGPVIRQAMQAVHNDPKFEGTKRVTTTGIDAAVQKPLLSARVASAKATLQREGQWQYGTKVNLEGYTEGDDGTRTVTVQVRNLYCRHLAVYTLYRDSAGKPLTLAEAQDPGLNQSAFNTDYLRYLGMLPAPVRIFGIPINAAFPDDLSPSDTFTIDLPAKAVTMELVTGAPAYHKNCLLHEETHGGVSMRPYEGADGPAMGATVLFEYGFPMLFLSFGIAGTKVEAAYGALQAALFKIFVALFVQLPMNMTANAGYGTGSSGPAQWAGQGFVLLETILKYCMSTGIKKGLKYSGTELAKGALTEFSEMFTATVAEAEAEEVAEEATPIVGWIMIAVDAAITVADMATTTAQIFESAGATSQKLTFTHDVQVVITPDKDDFEFPATATTCSCHLSFEDGTHPRAFTHQSVPSPAPKSVNFTFKDVPSGGRVKVNTQFYSAKGHLVGFGELRVDNVSKDSAGLTVNLAITEKPPELKAGTGYVHKLKLGVAADGKLAWQGNTKAPVAQALDCGTAAGALCTGHSLSLHNKTGQLALAWQSVSTGAKACGSGTALSQSSQALGLNLDPSKGGPEAVRKDLACQSDKPVHVLYGNGTLSEQRHFVLVADASGTYHAREISLDSTSGTWSVDGPSWGRFVANNIAAACLHPQGFIAALNGDFSKLEVLDISTAPNPKSGPRFARMFGGAGSRPGLFLGGKAVAATHRGQTLLILEDTNKRIQAVDPLMQPVDDYFAPTSDTTSPFAPLKVDANETVTWLDMKVERSGYIYVLSHVDAGAKTEDFRLDLYAPQGDWLSRTTGVAALRMCVDPWRNVYTLNAEKLTLSDGMTLPTVSQWIPDT